jgi:hypothetical protein
MKNRIMTQIVEYLFQPQSNKETDSNVFPLVPIAAWNDDRRHASTAARALLAKNYNY